MPILELASEVFSFLKVLLENIGHNVHGKLPAMNGMNRPLGQPLLYNPTLIALKRLINCT